MKLLGSTEDSNGEKKNKNGDNLAHLPITEVELVHWNIVNNNYPQDVKVFYKFVPNKSFGSLLEIALTNLFFLKTFNLEFLYIKEWFTDQSSQPLEIEDRINLTLVIKWYS